MIKNQKRALVIGGSVGGLFAASLLRNAGWDVVIFERSKNALDGRGAGIGLSQELLDVMEQIGVPFETKFGVAKNSRVWLGRDGNIRHEHPYTSVGSSWTRVYRPLRAAFPNEYYKSGMTLISIIQNPGSVTAKFANGDEETGDLLIAADGNLSTVRSQFLPDVMPHYGGYVAWRGVVDAAEIPLETARLIADHNIFSFHENQFMLTMLVPDNENDGEDVPRRCYWVWYKPAFTEDERRAIFTDGSGKYHGSAIPPPLIHQDLVDEVKVEAGKNFAPVVAAMVAKAPQLLVQAMSDFISPNLVFDRVVLLGDAAFVARPHVAGGISKAALNAKYLVEALQKQSSIEAALEDYNVSQQALGCAIVEHGRNIGYFVEQGRLDIDPGDDRKKFLDPVHILEQYGAPHILHDADPSKFRKI